MREFTLHTTPDERRRVHSTPSIEPKDRRRPLRQRRVPVAPASFRKRKTGDQLEDLILTSGITRKGEDRCGAIGLVAGDCREWRLPDSTYCRYHDKLQRGLTEPTADIYPVWPLPEEGYVLTEEVEQSWVA